MGKYAKFPNHLLESEINPKNQKYIDEFLEESKKQNLQKSTIQSYTRAFNRIFKYKENWSVDYKDYTNDTYDTFILELMDNDYGENRINCWRYY